jgi:hypothetical protein
VELILTHDPIFTKFLPFVKRGDIILTTGKFPSLILLPKGDNTDGVEYYRTPRNHNSNNETLVRMGLYEMSVTRNGWS